MMQSKNFRKVSVTKKFNLKREPMGRSLVCSRASGRRFCFGRSFDVSSMFWTSVVQVEQMDKKVDPRHLKTRRERPKSAPYLRLKNIQGTTIGKIWKKKFFQKKNFDFFSKKVFFRSHNAEKLIKKFMV